MASDAIRFVRARVRPKHVIYMKNDTFRAIRGHSFGVERVLAGQRARAAVLAHCLSSAEPAPDAC